MNKNFFSKNFFSSDISFNSDPIPKRKLQEFTPDCFLGNSRRDSIQGLFSKNKRNSAGFTLVELLVGITMFSLILYAIMGTLIYSIRLQEKYLSAQEALSQLSFAIEYMSRALRMAIREKSDPPACLSSQGLNYENPGGSISAIQFINHLQGDDCQRFFLDGNTKTLKYVKDVGGPGEETLSLTADIEVDQLKFRLEGESEADTSQPRLTIFLKIISPLDFELQTTISQRNLDEP